jgi:hypothetical protein
MVLINIKKVSEAAEDIKNDGIGKIVEAAKEARVNYNVLADAINQLASKLDEIDKKLDDKINDGLAQTVADIKLAIPELKLGITRSRELSEAKLKDAMSGVELKHEQLEAHGRRLNIIINGCKEEKQEVTTPSGGKRQFEDTEAIFRDFLVQSLNLSEDFVKSVILRDCHRIPKSKKAKATDPPPIIAAFVCQRQRNDVMAAAKNLEKTNYSIKSDLPKRLNSIRSEMLKVRRDLKKEKQVVRLIERNYLPCLQRLDNATNKWNIIYDISGPKIDIPGDTEDVPAGAIND